MKQYLVDPEIIDSNFPDEIEDGSYVPVALWVYDDDREYYFKDKPYRILFESHRKDIATDSWVRVIIYQCLYNNPDGMVWTRDKTEFFEKFKIKEDAKTV